MVALHVLAGTGQIRRCALPVTDGQPQPDRIVRCGVVRWAIVPKPSLSVSLDVDVQVRPVTANEFNNIEMIPREYRLFEAGFKGKVVGRAVTS